MEYTIKMIENLTENEVKAMEHETLSINGHEVYLVDFGGYFGYSALVFRSGHHLYYANDYELHHKHMSREELTNWYKETLSNNLFSDDMIARPVSDYIESEKKEYYLRNYYPLMCDDRVSAFQIFHNDKEERDYDRKVKGMIYNPVGFFYTKNKDFSDKLIHLYMIAIKSEKGQQENYDYWFSAFKYEMFNHEYAINWTPDTDTLSAFGNIPYDLAVKFNDTDTVTLDNLFDCLKFNDTQRKAYRDARSYVLRNSDY